MFSSLFQLTLSRLHVRLKTSWFCCVPVHLIKMDHVAFRQKFLARTNFTLPPPPYLNVQFTLSGEQVNISTAPYSFSLLPQFRLQIQFSQFVISEKERIFICCQLCMKGGGLGQGPATGGEVACVAGARGITRSELENILLAPYLFESLLRRIRRGCYSEHEF